MDVQQPRPRKDRPIFIDLLIIAATLGFLMYGGLQLLGKTRNAWDARDAERRAAAADIRLAAELGIEEARRDDARRRLDRLQAERARQEARIKNRRCVGGVLFAEIDGVLTNVGRC